MRVFVGSIPTMENQSFDKCALLCAIECSLKTGIKYKHWENITDSINQWRLFRAENPRGNFERKSIYKVILEHDLKM